MNRAEAVALAASKGYTHVESFAGLVPLAEWGASLSYRGETFRYVERVERASDIGGRGPGPYLLECAPAYPSPVGLAAWPLVVAS